MTVFSRSTALLALAIILAILGCAAAQQLSPNFYSKTCPQLSTIVRSGMVAAVEKEKRMGASILRMFFHDCFVNGCDGSNATQFSTNFVIAVIKMGNLKPSPGTPTEVRLNRRKVN